MRFATITSTFYIPSEIISETETYLKRKGKLGKEGLVLWAGKKINESQFIVTIRLVGGSAWGEGVALKQKDMIKLVTELSKNRLALLVQVHSHPNKIEHSLGDDRNPVSFHIGYISIVVWNYGLSGMKLLENCYIYEYQGKLYWKKLSAEEIKERFIILPSEIKI